MRIVLQRSASFAGVDVSLAHLGFTLQEARPQVFPARPDPARAYWARTTDTTIAVFRYVVNPDRRTLDAEGPAAADVIAHVRGTVGSIPAQQMRAELLGDDEEAAFRAAFDVAASHADDALALLQRAFAQHDAYVGSGCLRAVEALGDGGAAPWLRSVAADAEVEGDLRLLAREVAATVEAHVH